MAIRDQRPDGHSAVVAVLVAVCISEANGLPLGHSFRSVASVGWREVHVTRGLGDGQVASQLLNFLHGRAGHGCRAETCVAERVPHHVLDTKSKVRANVEWPFRILKRVFGFTSALSWFEEEPGMAAGSLRFGKPLPAPQTTDPLTARCLWRAEERLELRVRSSQ